MKLLEKNIVCLGGGIGTVNLVKGLKNYTKHITIVISMADNGGSSGRLRRLYNMPPTGDLVSCMAALAKEKNPFLSKVLTYRFSGDRYGKDDRLPGHKLGNLIMVAMNDLAGSFEGAIALFQKTFDIPGVFLPATHDSVSIAARTIDGLMVEGEETIDLGRYKGKRILDQVFLQPEDAKAGNGVLEAIEKADVIIAGPGDLYTTILPVLIVPNITRALQKSHAKKIFVVNVANKPFETRGYSIQNFIEAVIKHVGSFPFDVVVANSNTTSAIPSQYKYDYVKNDKKNPAETTKTTKLLFEDLTDPEFPLYHNPAKLAKAISQEL